MMSVIVEVKISDLGEIITGNTPPTSDRTLYDGDYPLIMPTDIIEGDKFINHTEETVSEKGFKKYKKSLIPANMPCVVTIGSIGKKLCLTKVDSFTNQAINAIIVYLDKYDPDFVFYLMKYNLPQVKNLSSGTASGRENVSKSSFGKIKVKLPKDLLVQKKIASILSAYDDLIENNNQRIQLLEDMASEIYKEWFVRFRFPNYQNTKFLDKDGKEVAHGTKDAIPEGWERAKLPKHIDFLEGPGLRNYQYTESGIHYLNIRVMGQNDLFLNKAGFLDTDEVNKRYPHFLLKENDHVVSSSGTIGRVVTIRNSHLPLCLNTSIIRMRKIHEGFGTWLIKQYLKSFDFQGQISSFAIGAAQANFGPSHLSLIKATIPTKNIAVNFEGIVGPMEEEIKILLDKNQILQETRDLLLPRLISGKLSVENLEVEENLNMAAEPSEKF